ncbi:unnamed protein product [Symbiodinium natans]|uniref:Polyketide synthase-like phosphopantetheine-binding domain-containing protein n=1 Tax=Symbiodinium natans TaxID=878477 RepID=A0A812UGG7_9DINO|nr:unnamed protein product [Symbiodinium natans]
MAASRRSPVLPVLTILCMVGAPTFMGFRPTANRRIVSVNADPKPAFKGDKPAHPILDSGCTDLMQAAYKGDTGKVKDLVEKGADINGQDAYGWTAVRYAVRNRQLDSVQALLDLGADINLASKTGRTPLMSAAGNGLEEICKLLVEQGDADIMALDDGGKTAYDLALRTGPLGSDLIRDLVAGGQTAGAGEDGYQRLLKAVTPSPPFETRCEWTRGRGGTVALSASCAEHVSTFANQKPSREFPGDPWDVPCRAISGADLLEGMAKRRSVRDRGEQPGACGDGRRERAYVLAELIRASVQLADLEGALSAASDAQELFREVGDQRAEASAAHLVARIQLQRQDFSAARLAADTARALLRQTSELGREAGMLLLSSQAGSLELAAGAVPGGGKAARSFFEGRGRNKVLATSKEAVALSKRLSSNHMVAVARLAHARAKVSSGLLDGATEDLQEALPVLQELGDHRAVGAAKLLQANISILQGAPDVAAAKEALESLRTAGSSHEVALAQALVAKMSRATPQAPRPAAGAAQAQAPVSAEPTAAVAKKPAVVDKMALALPDRVKYTLTELVAEAIGQEGMEEDRTLMETGMTSIASIMLRDKIQAEFPEIPEMDLTFVFDYPTIREMTGFVLTQLPNDA